MDSTTVDPMHVDDDVRSRRQPDASMSATGQHAARTVARHDNDDDSCARVDVMTDGAMSVSMSTMSDNVGVSTVSVYDVSTMTALVFDGMCRCRCHDSVVGQDGTTCDDGPSVGVDGAGVNDDSTMMMVRCMTTARRRWCTMSMSTTMMVPATTVDDDGAIACQKKKKKAEEVQVRPMLQQSAAWQLQCWPAVASQYVGRRVMTR